MFAEINPSHKLSHILTLPTAALSFYAACSVPETLDFFIIISISAMCIFIMEVMWDRPDFEAAILCIPLPFIVVGMILGMVGGFSATFSQPIDEDGKTIMSLIISFGAINYLFSVLGVAVGKAFITLKKRYDHVTFCKIKLADIPAKGFAYVCISTCIAALVLL